MERLTIIFDESCGICLACVTWLQRRDLRAQFEFIGNQANELPQSVDRAQAADTIYVVNQSTGTTRTRADAIAQLLRTLPGRRAAVFRVAGYLMMLPVLRQFSNLCYRLIAKHRQRISTALGLTACEIRRKRADATTN